MNHQKVVRVPGSYPIFLVQLAGIALIIDSFYAIGKTIISASSVNILMLTIVFVLFLLPGVLLLYLSRKYLTKVIVSKDHNFLRIEKRGKKEREFGLDNIERFVSQDFLYPMSSFRKINISIETVDNKSITLFEDDQVQFLRGWHRFSEKISDMTGKPLKKEVWVENQIDGKFILKD